MKFLNRAVAVMVLSMCGMCHATDQTDADADKTTIDQFFSDQAFVIHEGGMLDHNTMTNIWSLNIPTEMENGPTMPPGCTDYMTAYQIMGHMHADLAAMQYDSNYYGTLCSELETAYGYGNNYYAVANYSAAKSNYDTCLLYITAANNTTTDFAYHRQSYHSWSLLLAALGH